MKDHELYICPECHEEVPVRVKVTTEVCPFCLEPWPSLPDLSPEATESAPLK
jgi:hypothetical protein